MKKLLTALIAFVMCFSLVTTAFAATPDETSDSDLISDIKQAMLDTYYGDEKPDFIEVRIYGTASDGGVYFDFMDSFTHWTDEVEFDIGDYTVSYPRDCPVLLYKNNKVYTLSDAYETGVIDDDMLYELYVWGKIDVVKTALISNIKRAIINMYYDGKAPEYLNVEILLDDEDEVYFSFSDSFATSANRVYTEAGNYIVSYLENCPVALYKNNRVYMIPDAYNSGVIDDETLDGLSCCGNMDIIPKSYDTALIIEIKKKVIEECFDGKTPETLRIDIVGTTSDGGVYYRHNYGMSLDYGIKETIGDNYTYRYTHDNDVMLYKDSSIYSIKDAYESGVINDDIMKELISWNFGIHSNTPETTAPIEPTTSTATPDEPTTSPAATSATKPVSTKDTATKDTPNNSQNNSGAVQTGENSVAVILVVAMLAGCAVIFAKRRNYFK